MVKVRSKKAKAQRRIRRNTARKHLPAFPLFATGLNIKRARHTTARYATRTMQAHDWHRLPNNFHEQSHLVRFYLLQSKQKVQPVRHLQNQVGDKRESILSRQEPATSRRVLFRAIFPLPEDNISEDASIHFPDTTYPVPLIPFRIR